MKYSTLVYPPFTTFIKFSTISQKRSMVLMLFAPSIFENVGYAYVIWKFRKYGTDVEKISCTFIKAFLRRVIRFHIQRPSKATKIHQETISVFWQERKPF